MKRCGRIWVVAFWSLLAGSKAQADQIDDYLKSEMASHRIPGVALVVIREGHQIKNAAYGIANLELNAPVKTNTVFEIGSITKQFTAAAILLLVQEGKLSVDEQISRHLKATPASWTNITVRHLLTHTSGIKSYTGLEGFALTKHLTQEQFIKAIGDYPLEFEPGASWKYCNTGYNLLGFIIENISGKSYWDFMQERIFKPLRMNGTCDRKPSSLIPNRAAGYEQTNQTWINRDYDITDVFSAGALASTTQDMARWNAVLDGDELLKAPAKALMWTPAKLNEGTATKYGFGWFVESVEGHRNIGHGGSTSGFSASIQRFPDDDLAVIVLTNTDEQIATVLAKRIASLCFLEVKESSGKPSGIRKIGEQNM